MASITKGPHTGPGANKAEKKTQRTNVNAKEEPKAWAWWKAGSKSDMAAQLVDTAQYLKKAQEYRVRQASFYSMLYGNHSLMSFFGYSNQILKTTRTPYNRPTMNVIQSIIDTKIARITQQRPRPYFLTDDGNSSERTLAKQLNKFIAGEIYQTRAYELGELLLRDASVLGTGCAKVYRTIDDKVGLERRLCTELFVDPVESAYGKPLQMYELRLVDRAFLIECYPEYKSMINKATQGYTTQDMETVSDQVIVAEGWRLPSAPGGNDGMHAIACSSGLILEEPWTKTKFPFVFLHDTPRLLGFWAQGVPERLMGNQVEINKILTTISQSIQLVGVPRVLMEQASKVASAQFNNTIGNVIKYHGVAPQIVPGDSGIAADIYGHLMRLIQFAYQQEGVSSMVAGSEKPQGLNSGEAIRSYDNLSTDRMAALSKRYSNMYEDFAYQIIELAGEIAEDTGKYQTVYVENDRGQRSSRQVDLPSFEKLNDPFVIQCYEVSSLPRDPAGRLQKVTEMLQAGMISMPEGRRLLDFPDIEQVNKLAAAQEERLYKVLDDMVEHGKYTPPDPFMISDPQLATTTVVQYYNRFAEAGTSEERLKMLRDFFTQVQDLIKASQPPPPPMPPGAPGAPPPGGGPIAVPQAPPGSDLLPVGPKG